MRAGWWLDAAVLAALLALFLWLAPPASTAPYGYDEADYMYAVTLGRMRVTAIRRRWR